MVETPIEERNLAMEAVRITEAAALAAARHMGRGDERAADRAAVEAMHAALGRLHVDGTVRIGEGEAGEAAELFVGERLGAGGPRVDVGLCPLEGASITARGGHEALSVVAMAEEGGILRVPAVYMDKIAVDATIPEGVVDLDAAPGENLRELAKYKGVEVADLAVCLLDRPRHGELIAKVREAGARIQLIEDGDVSGAIAAGWPGCDLDMYMGIGSAPQGVLAAAALTCLGGHFQGRLVLRGEADRQAVKAAGIDDPGRKLERADMASGDVTFASTGVTPGSVLAGVRYLRKAAITHSVVMRSKTGTVRFIEAHHDFSRTGRIA